MARVNDTVHVQVEIVILHPIWVGLARVWVDPGSADPPGQLLFGVFNGLRVPLTQPSVQAGDAHPSSQARRLPAQTTAALHANEGRKLQPESGTGCLQGKACTGKSPRTSTTSICYSY
eukprot:2444896-Rhodomonas_salina.1